MAKEWWEDAPVVDSKEPSGDEWWANAPLVDAKPKSRTWGEAITDTGKSIASGVNAVGEELGNLRDSFFTGVDNTIASGATLNAVAQKTQIDEANSKLAKLMSYGEGDTPEAEGLHQTIAHYNKRMPKMIGSMTEAQADAQRGAAMTTRPAVVAMGKAKTFGEAWDIFKENPYDVIAGVTATSLPGTIPALIVGAVMGPTAGAAAMGGSSAVTEAGSSIADFARDSGVDVTDRKAVEAFFADRENLAKAMSYAGKRAGIIGALDAVSGGLAGKTIAPAFKSAIAKQAVNIPSQMAVQAGLGAGGEAGGQLATKGSIDQPGQVLMEAAGELSGAPAEVAAFSKDARNAFLSRKAPAKSDPVQAVMSAVSIDEAIKVAYDSVATATQPIARASDAELLARLMPKEEAGRSISDVGQEWQALGVFETGDASNIAVRRSGQQWQEIAQDNSSGLVDQREREGAARSAARDASIAEVGQRWQDLGITQPQDDLQAQKSGMRGEPTAMQLAMQRAIERSPNGPTGQVLGANTERSGNDGDNTTGSVGDGGNAGPGPRLDAAGIPANQLAKPAELPSAALAPALDQRLIPTSKRNEQNTAPRTDGQETQAAPVETRASEAGNATTTEVLPGAGSATIQTAGVDSGFTQSLSKDSSWVIKNKQTGDVVMETFDKKKVKALNTEKYEAVPIQEHLGGLNQNATPADPRLIPVSKRQQATPKTPKNLVDQGANTDENATKSVANIEKNSVQVAALGKEVSRYTGKFGKGMGRDAARLEASRLNRTNDGIAYTAEEHDDPKLENPYAVVGRKPVSKSKTQEQKPAQALVKHDDVATETVAKEPEESTKPTPEQVQKSDPVAEAKTALDASNITGKERLDIIKDVKSGALTVDEVKEAYPAKDDDAKASRTVDGRSADGNTPGVGITKPMLVDPATLEFREKEQNRKSELGADTDEFDPIVVIGEGRKLSILDGHNRASVALDRGDKLKAVRVTSAEYKRLQEKGFDDGEIAWAALQRADQSYAADNLDSQFPGSNIRNGGDKAWDDLIENESTAPDSGAQASKTDIRASRNVEPAADGITREQFIDALAKAFGDKTASRLLDKKVIIAVDTKEDLPQHLHKLFKPTDNVFGFQDPKTNATYAVLDSLSPDMVKGLILHEVGIHYGFKEMLGDKYDQIVNRMDLMRRGGNKEVKEAYAIAAKNAIKVSQIPEEHIAYMVQTHPEMGIVKEIIARIKAFVFNKFGIGESYLTPDDIVMLARAAVQHSARKDGGGIFSPDMLPQASQDAQLSRNIATGLPDETRLQKVQRLLQDKYNRVKLIQDLLLEDGGVVGEKQDVYRAEERMHGRVHEVLRDFADDVVNPLIKKATKYGVDLNELAAYVYAKHAAERNAQIQTINKNVKTGSGMSDADAQSAIYAVKKSGKQKEFEELHADLMAITSTTRRLMLDEGLITQEHFDAMEGQYENYVPLRGFEDVEPETGSVRPGLGRGFNTKGKETIAAMGRDSKAGDIIENIIRDYERATIRAERNTVGKAFLDLVTSNPDPALWEVQPMTRVALKINGLVEYVDVHDEGDDTIAVKVAGEVVYIKINDPLLLRAMANTFKSETSDAERFLSNTLGLYTSLLRNTITRYNPAFGVINAVRDVQMGAMGVYDELGAEGVRRYAENYGPAVASSGRTEMGKSDPQNKNMDKWMREMRFAGGTTGGVFMRDHNTIKKELRDTMLQAGLKPNGVIEGVRASGAWKATGKLLHGLELIGSMSENSARLAAYATAREMGKTPAQAASIAKNLTVNFNRFGEQGQLINTAFLFYNASVQGTVRIVQMAKNPKVRKAIAGMTAAGMSLALMGAAVGGDDEDGQAYWDKIPDFEKERNLIIMLPPGVDMGDKVGTHGRYVKIPMAYGLNVFPVLGYQLANLARHTKDPAQGVGPVKAAINMLSATAGSYNPAGGSFDPRDKVQLAMAVSPTIVDAGIQLGAGVDSFGKPTGPQRSPYDQSPDSETVSAQNHGSINHRIARWMNDATGGNRARSGAIDVEPGTVKNVQSIVGGGLGKFIGDVVNLGYLGATDAPIKDRDIPVWKSFYGEYDSRSGMSQFYERSRKAAEEFADMKAEFKLGIKREYSEEEKFLQKMGAHAANVSTMFGQLKKEEVQVAESNSSAKEKELKRRMIQKRREKIAEDFNAQWYKKESELKRKD